MAMLNNQRVKSIHSPVNLHELELNRAWKIHDVQGQTAQQSRKWLMKCHEHPYNVEAPDKFH